MKMNAELTTEIISINVTGRYSSDYINADHLDNSYHCHFSLFCIYYIAVCVYKI